MLSSTDLAKNINHPLGPFLYSISCLHCLSGSLSQNGAGLDAMWEREKALDMLRDAGFTGVEVKMLSHDFQNFYYTATKPSIEFTSSSQNYTNNPLGLYFYATNWKKNQFIIFLSLLVFNEFIFRVTKYSKNSILLRMYHYLKWNHIL